VENENRPGLRFASVQSAIDRSRRFASGKDQNRVPTAKIAPNSAVWVNKTSGNLHGFASIQFVTLCITTTPFLEQLLRTENDMA
jgi:hypothetical protein